MSIPRQVKVGLFVTIGLLFTMAAIVLLGAKSNLFEKNYTLHAKFQDISGLRPGAGVYLAGITIGTVDEISFPKDLEDKQVEIRLKISKKYKDRIREDSTASIVTQGLLGDKVILLVVGSPQFAELADGASIKIKEGISFDNITAQGQDLITNVGDLSKNLNQLIGDIRQKEGLLHTLIYDKKGTELISRALSITEGIDQGIQTVKKGSGLLHSLIYTNEGLNVLHKLDSVVTDLKLMTTSLHQVALTVQKGEGSLGGLLHDPTIYYNLKEILGGAARSKLLQDVIRYTINKNEKETLK